MHDRHGFLVPAGLTSWDHFPDAGSALPPGGTCEFCFDVCSLVLAVGLLTKKPFLTMPWSMNHTDRHLSVWTVVRLVGSDFRIPILLNSPMMRVAVFLSQFQSLPSSTLEAMNWPADIPAEKLLPETVVCSISAMLRKVRRHIILFTPGCRRRGRQAARH